MRHLLAIDQGTTGTTVLVEVGSQSPVATDKSKKKPGTTAELKPKIQRSSNNLNNNFSFDRIIKEHCQIIVAIASRRLDLNNFPIHFIQPNEESVVYLLVDVTGL